MKAESGTIRIGTTSTQKATYIAGIFGTSVTGSAVIVSSTGQLGVTVSLERYKAGITPVGSTSQKLRELRPVTFHIRPIPMVRCSTVSSPRKWRRCIRRL